MADPRELWIAGQGKRNVEDARRKAAANTPQVMMSQTPEWYQDRGNLSRAKDVLQHMPAVTTDQNESRNMYQMLMNQMKGGDKGARLIDTRGLPDQAYRTGRTIFQDPSKSQGFFGDLRTMAGDLSPLSRRPNPAAIHVNEYNPFPKAGFGADWYKDEFGSFDPSGLFEGILKLATPLKYFKGKKRTPLERDSAFTPVPGSADWESSVFDPIETEEVDEVSDGDLWSIYEDMDPDLIDAILKNSQIPESPYHGRGELSEDFDYSQFPSVVEEVIDEDVTDDSVVENIEEVIEEPDDEEIFNQTYEFIQDRGDDPDLPTPWEYMIKMQDLLGWEDERMIQHLIDNGVLRAK